MGRVAHDIYLHIDSTVQREGMGGSLRSHNRQRYMACCYKRRQQPHPQTYRSIECHIMVSYMHGVAWLSRSEKEVLDAQVH